MNIAVLDLVFARASETAIIRAMAHMLASLPPFVHVAYDKGVRGMRSMLPNFNFVFMPCFLAPAKGKTSFTGEEASANKAIARCRYVVEITYTRVKDWKILAGEVPRENFHLLNSAWWWALGHANMCRGFLVRPPDVSGSMSPLEHYSKWVAKQRDVQMADA